MSNGELIESRMRDGTRPVCVMTGIEGKILARRYGDRPVAEALRLEEERQSEADRREFVKRLWARRNG
jgi:hypothetical protein